MGRSTEQTLAEITENLKKIYNDVLIGGLFVDFVKAFDTVDHEILLMKLQAYGKRGIPLEWFTSYLYNRKQYVTLNGMKSTKQTVVCGVPQESSLGPLLLLICINDIPYSSDKQNFRLFADDINVIASSASEHAKVKKWCDIKQIISKHQKNSLHDHLRSKHQYKDNKQ